MKIFANFEYGFDGYSIENISTSPDSFSEDDNVMVCNVDSSLSNCQLNWEFDSDYWKPYNGVFSIDYFRDNDGNYISIPDVIDCEDGNYGVLYRTYSKGKKISEEFVLDEFNELNQESDEEIES